MAISHWPLERAAQREAYCSRARSALSDAELLAIFLRTGLPGITAIDSGPRAAGEFGGLGPLLGRRPHKRSVQAKGVGTAKFVQLKAPWN